MKNEQISREDRAFHESDFVPQTIGEQIAKRNGELYRRVMACSGAMAVNQQEELKRGWFPLLRRVVTN